MDDYNSKSSCQARFIEQQEADTKQELIDISIRHQILSPFTAFIGIETRTEQEIAATSGEMILREVPIEIRTSGNASDEDDRSGTSNYLMPVPRRKHHSKNIWSRKLCTGSLNTFSLVSDDRRIAYDECDEDDVEEGFIVDDPLKLVQRPFSCTLKSYYEILRSSKRCRSRSRSPRRRRSSSSAEEDSKNDIIPSDTIRQIIGLQNFSGLWSMNDLNKKILDDYKDKDNDVILSMIIMFIFTKYFIDDEALWKPVIKKCAKAIENQVGKKEYNELTDKIKQIV
jgi:hypothetical protein